MTTAIFPDLAGASVFITGGGSGIGAALTDGFLTQGANVGFIGRSDARGFVADMAAKHGRAPLFIQGDITDTNQLRGAMDRAAQAHGGLHILVNNAANDMRMVAAQVTPSDWDDQMAVNLKSYFFACQKAHDLFAGAGGTIVNFSSISYLMGMGGMVPYTTANAGITSMSKTLAQEWGPDNIRVNALAPGWVMTERQKRDWVTPEGLASYLEKQSLKVLMQPEDMVAPTLFLASKASQMVTGQVLVVDAGVARTG